MQNYTIAGIIVIIISFALPAYFYPQLPNEMAIHWNFNGEADGYAEKNIALAFMPILSIILLAVFTALPKIDPQKKNIEKFSGTLGWFIALILSFLLYIQIVSIAWNLDFQFSMIQALVPAFAILFYCLGVLTARSKRNYSIGIRTPWTLASEEVWKKTHEVGGILFKLSGIIALAGLISPNYAFYIVLGPVLASSLALYIYSYRVYKAKSRKK